MMIFAAMTLPQQIAARTRLHALRAQALALRDPSRKSGPSRYEAEDAAKRLEEEADEIEEELYWTIGREISAATSANPVGISA